MMTFTGYKFQVFMANVIQMKHTDNFVTIPGIIQVDYVESMIE
jgi:hypothetical protein